MDFLSNYIELIVLGICLCVGYIIKNLIPGDKINRFIPLIMGVLGIIMSFWMHNWQINPHIMLNGLVSGLASTGAYEAFNQFIKIRKCDKVE